METWRSFIIVVNNYLIKNLEVKEVDQKIIVYDKIKAILKVIEIANQESNKVEKQENKVIGDETIKTGPCD